MLKDILKNLRYEAGLTQGQVAEVLSISRSTYTYYETGKTKPSLDSLKMIAKIFNVTTDYLLENTDSVIYKAPVGAGVAQTGGGYKVFGSEIYSLSELDNTERRIVLSYRMLSDEEKQQVAEDIDKRREAVIKKG